MGIVKKEAHRGSSYFEVIFSYLLFGEVTNAKGWRGAPFYEVPNRLCSSTYEAPRTTKKATSLLRPNRWALPYLVCVFENRCA